MQRIGSCPVCSAASFKSIASLEAHVQRCLDGVDGVDDLSGGSCVEKVHDIASQSVLEDSLLAASIQQEQEYTPRHQTSSDYTSRAQARASHLQESPHFRGGTAEDLEAWLRENPPSAHNSAQGGYIYADDCSGLRGLLDDACYNEEGRVDRLVGEWQRLEQEAQEGIRSPPGAEDLDRLSLQHHVLDGKWLISGIPSHEVDHVWAAIAREVVSGGLGTSAKVSGGQKKEFICVYTYNFLDKDDVSRVRAKLWDMGHRKKLFYKTDAYTCCGIYWGTHKHLLPTKYSSSSRDALEVV